MLIGIVGKPNVGKSTFFSAATLANAEIANYPFTTIEPNRGVAYVRSTCPCREFGVECDPRNSLCIDGVRMVPVELLDVAGLVPDAWQGKGLGNQFLDDLRQADALINVVDASGGTDLEGNPVDPGTHDPMDDVEFLATEVTMWIRGILNKGFDKMARQAHLQNMHIETAIYERLTGLGVSEVEVTQAVRGSGVSDNPMKWTDDDLTLIADAVRRTCKPLVVALNKADLASEESIERMVSETGGVPTLAESELALRRASKGGVLDYLPGEPGFTIREGITLNDGQQKALDYIARNMERFNGTGVQSCIELTAREVLDLITVYPVEDETHLTDHDGRVLPDAFLMPRGSTAKDLAYKVHTELGDNFIRAINARNHRVIGHDYELQDGDVIKIVSRK